ADGPSALGAEAGISHPFIVVAGEPAGGLRVVGQETEEVVQPVGIETNGRRELPQDRAQLLAQLEDPGGEEVGEGGLRVGELLVVGDETASLDGEDEVGRGLRMPVADRARPGEAVEGAVDLDGPEAGRGVLQFPSLGEPFRVEAATPVPVAPARNADPDLSRRLRLPGGYGGKRLSRGPPRT